MIGQVVASAACPLTLNIMTMVNRQFQYHKAAYFISLILMLAESLPPRGLQKIVEQLQVSSLVSYCIPLILIPTMSHRVLFFSNFSASNYGGIIAYFLMPAIATGKERIGFTVSEQFPTKPRF